MPSTEKDLLDSLKETDYPEWLRISMEIWRAKTRRFVVRTVTITEEWKDKL